MSGQNTSQRSRLLYMDSRRGKRCTERVRKANTASIPFHGWTESRTTERKGCVQTTERNWLPEKEIEKHKTHHNVRSRPGIDWCVQQNEQNVIDHSQSNVKRTRNERSMVDRNRTARVCCTIASKQKSWECTHHMRSYTIKRQHYTGSR